MNIGPYTLASPFIVAPMAGVTDRPFRALCREMGAGLAVCEMVSAQEHLWTSEKSLQRCDHEGEALPIAAQILGNNPEMMAKTAQHNVGQGAHIIDINMGCPAKKVCKKAAGSALLQDEKLVKEILEAVVASVTVPVTLKIRTGWDREHKNALAIARIAERSGIQALTIHGRTRIDAFMGDAEYDTIAEVKSRVAIPVIANGDITSLKDARAVLEYTKADALMIGRGALGNPWIFSALANNKAYTPSPEEFCRVLLGHVRSLHQFYGHGKGVRVARKHILWYLERVLPQGPWRMNVLSAQTESEQLCSLEHVLQQFKLVA